MKVSVIVPVYNTKKYLKNCLDSLLNQTLKEVEIIAVDDGSTDGCAEILDQYHQNYPEQIQVFHKENGGQAIARNLALSQCKGDYIGFLDSDDFVDAEMFQLMYEKAVAYHADYVACGYRDTTYQNGKQIILKKYVASKVATKTEDLFFGALVSPWLHIYKREILMENHIIFPEGLIYEDTAFYLNAIPYIHRIGVVEKAVATRVRRRASTMTITKKEKVAQIFPVLKNAIDFYQKNGFYQQYQKELEYFCVRILLCSSMQRIARVKGWGNSWELVMQTMQFIQNYFPNYRKNSCFQSGLSNLYIKSFGKGTAWLYLALFKMKVKTERQYQ